MAAMVELFISTREHKGNGFGKEKAPSTTTTERAKRRLRVIDYRTEEFDADEPFPPYSEQAASRVNWLKTAMESSSRGLKTANQIIETNSRERGPAKMFTDNTLATYPTLRAFYNEKVGHYQKLYPGAPVPLLLPGVRTSWVEIAMTFDGMGPHTYPPSSIGKVAPVHDSDTDSR